MGKSWEVYAETPSGENIPIIKIPDWDFDWQGFYYPEYMQYIPEGSRIEAVATYNNTNDFNMGWGELTTDEMFFCPIYYVPYQEGDEEIYLGIEEQTNLSEIDDIKELELFPNPANGFIEILYDLDDSQNLNWDLFDAKGKQIEVISSKNYKSGRNSINLDIKDLKRGMYFIKIQSHKKFLSRAFIKN